MRILSGFDYQPRRIFARN